MYTLFSIIGVCNWLHASHGAAHHTAGGSLAFAVLLIFIVALSGTVLLLSFKTKPDRRDKKQPLK
ncbi:Sporulation protein YjcZ [Paenibacillus tarimensis]